MAYLIATRSLWDMSFGFFSTLLPHRPFPGLFAARLKHCIG